MMNNARAKAMENIVSKDLLKMMANGRIDLSNEELSMLLSLSNNDMESRQDKKQPKPCGSK